MPRAPRRCQARRCASPSRPRPPATTSRSGVSPGRHRSPVRSFGSPRSPTSRASGSHRPRSTRSRRWWRRAGRHEPPAGDVHAPDRHYQGVTTELGRYSIAGAVSGGSRAAVGRWCGPRRSTATAPRPPFGRQSAGGAGHAARRPPRHGPHLAGFPPGVAYAACEGRHGLSLSAAARTRATAASMAAVQVVGFPPEVAGSRSAEPGGAWRSLAVPSWTSTAAFRASVVRAIACTGAWSPLGDHRTGSIDRNSRHRRHLTGIRPTAGVTSALPAPRAVRLPVAQRHVSRAARRTRRRAGSTWRSARSC